MERSKRRATTGLIPVCVGDRLVAAANLVRVKDAVRLEQFIEGGLDVNAVEDNGKGVTLMHYAAQEGSVEIIKLLLRHSAHYDTLNRDGITPFYLACQNGFFEIANILIQLPNVNINVITVKGCTPLFAASQEGHLDIVKLLLSHKASLHSRTVATSATPLHVASQMGHKAVVEELIAAGSDVDAFGIHGSTPLIIALQRLNVEIAKILIAAKANVSYYLKDGNWTPLHLAALIGEVELVQSIIDAGCSIEESTTCAYTAMHIAAFNGHTSVIECLVKNGACFDQQRQRCGRTPLHIAVQKNYYDMAVYLLGIGASLTLRTINNRTPFDCAVNDEMKNLIQVTTENRFKNSLSLENKCYIYLKNNKVDVSNIPKYVIQNNENMDMYCNQSESASTPVEDDDFSQVD
jgi:ankyrin repeat protein